MSERLKYCSQVSLLTDAAAVFIATLAYAADPVVMPADYAAANAMLGVNLRGLVRNESVQPHWIGDTGRFWYLRDGDRGPEFVVVTAHGVKSPAFNHERIAQALSRTLGAPPVAGGLPAPLAHAELSDDLVHLTGQVGGKSFDCNVKRAQCRVFDTPAPPPELLPSPDGRWAAFARDDNLFVREMATGHERQLTSDGAAFYSWLKVPESALTTVTREKSGAKAPPFATYWSPDGRYLIAPRIDERTVAVDPVVEWVPTDGSRRPIVHPVRVAFVGDPGVLKADYFLFDLKMGRRTQIPLPVDHQPGLNDLILGWSRKRGQAFLLSRAFALKSATVFRLDLVSGSLSKVLEESSSTRVETNTLLYSQPNMRIIGDGAELVGYSDRTGWGHLYLYDAQTGHFENAITQGPWLVKDIVAIDEERREIYFTALGREPGRDPYYRSLYRCRLDGRGDITLLTQPTADHLFEPNLDASSARLYGARAHTSLVNAAAGVFVDTWSTVDRPPMSVLRSTRDGHLIAVLERADASRLFAAGWTAPVRERLMAADGTTALYAAYLAPKGRFAGKREPVIDAVYGGPQAVLTPRNFGQAWRDVMHSEALTRLGFAVVIVDGRGTPMRSREFRDVGYPNFTQVGIDDHIAVIGELARRHPEMDVSHVGVYGWSWGGTFAAQAILSRPEFYTVAVAGSGLYDYAATYSGNDAFIGPPVYANGTRYRSRPDEEPTNWIPLDVTRLADRLTGHLLMIYGDLDENVPPNQTFRLVDALTKANKPYDLLYLPNRNHGAGLDDSYTVKRTWDYFVEHLHDTAPPWDFKITTHAGASE